LNTVTIRFKYRKSPTRHINYYYIGFDTHIFYKFRDELLKLKVKNNLFRPTVGIVDIGAMSWHKDFNIVDFGFLGNHVLAKEFNNKQLIRNYVFDYHAPDFIHLTDVFASHYGFLFNDKRFDKYYEPIYERIINKEGKRRNNYRSGLWIRKDIKIGCKSRERLFIDHLRNGLSVSYIKNEIDNCKKDKISPNYIIRTLYRFLPELKKETDIKKIISYFKNHSCYKLANAILSSNNNRNWHKELIAFLKKNLNINKNSINSQDNRET